MNKISLNQIKVNTERLLNELWFAIQMKFQTISKMTLNKLLPFHVIYLCKKIVSALTIIKNQKTDQLCKTLKMFSIFLQYQTFGQDLIPLTPSSWGDSSVDKVAAKPT